MIADMAAFISAFAALVVSCLFYSAHLTNVKLGLKAQNAQAQYDAMQPKLQALKLKLQDQQPEINAATASPVNTRPAIVSDLNTLADWNDNVNLKELLNKYGYRQLPPPPAKQGSKK